MLEPWSVELSGSLTAMLRFGWMLALHSSMVSQVDEDDDVA
jgi:hypothetical protein